MTDKERITEILKAYTKKHNIMASSVILEEYADELVKQGVVMPIRCKNCEYYEPRNSIGTQGTCNCGEMEMNYGGEFYPLHTDFCSYGELKEREKV